MGVEALRLESITVSAAGLPEAPRAHSFHLKRINLFALAISEVQTDKQCTPPSGAQAHTCWPRDATLHFNAACCVHIIPAQG